MFCKNCGKELPDTAKFCNGCGTPVSVPVDAAPVDTVPEIIEVPDAEVVVETVEAEISQEPETPQPEAQPQDDLAAAFEQAAEPVVAVAPVVEPVVQPVAQESAKEPILGQKKGRGKGLILLIPALLVVAVLVVVLVKFLPSGGGSGTNSIVYLTDDDELMFRKDLKAKTEAAELTDDYAYNVRFSENGKYLYYIESSSLYRMEIAKIGKKGAEPEKISSDAENYVVLKNGNVVYVKNDQMRFYDGKDSYKLASGVSSYSISVNEAETYAYYSEYVDGSNTFYRVQLKENGEKEKLIKEYNTLYYRGDDVLVYGKYDDSGYDVYSQVPGGDKTKLASEVSSVMNVGAEKGKVSMVYMTNETKDRNGYDVDCYNLCKYENGKETVLAEDIDYMAAYDAEAGVFLYVKYDDDYDAEWYQNIGGVESKFKVDEDANIYSLYVLNGNEAVLAMYEDGESVLKAYSISKNTMTSTTTITDDDYCSAAVGSYKGKDVLYYYTDLSSRGNEGELMRYSNGSSTSVAKDAYGVILLDDGNTVFKMEEAGEEVDLYLVKDGKSERVADEVSEGYFLSAKQLVYISDGDLYVWNGSKSEKLVNDVKTLWVDPNAEADREAYICYNY